MRCWCGALSGGPCALWCSAHVRHDAPILRGLEHQQQPTTRRCRQQQHGLTEFSHFVRERFTLSYFTMSTHDSSLISSIADSLCCCGALLTNLSLEHMSHFRNSFGLRNVQSLHAQPGALGRDVVQTAHRSTEVALSSVHAMHSHCVAVALPLACDSPQHHT